MAKYKVVKIAGVYQSINGILRSSGRVINVGVEIEGNVENKNLITNEDNKAGEKPSVNQVVTLKTAGAVPLYALLSDLEEMKPTDKKSDAQVSPKVEEGMKSFGKSVQIAGSVGLLAGLGFAYYRKSSVMGYIGFGLLFSVGFAVVGGMIGGKKAIAGLKGGASVGGGASASGSMSDKYISVLRKMMLTMGLADGTQDKIQKDFDAKVGAKMPVIKKALDAEIAKLTKDEKGALDEFLDYNLNQKITKEDFTDQAKQTAMAKKNDDFIATLKNKYNGVDVMAVNDKIMASTASLGIA